MDATFWATVALLIFLAIVFYLKVPGQIARSLDQNFSAVNIPSRKSPVGASASVGDFCVSALWAELIFDNMVGS